MTDTSYLAKAEAQIATMDGVLNKSKEEFLEGKISEAQVDELTEVSKVGYTRAQALATIDQAISLQRIAEALEAIRFQV